MGDFFKKAKERLTYIIKGGEDENISSSKKPEMISVLMQDGTIEEYPENFKITDGINCAVCLGETYHIHLDCPMLKMERDIHQVRGMYIKDAERKGIYKCWKCQEYDDIDKEWEKI